MSRNACEARLPESGCGASAYRIRIRRAEAEAEDARRARQAAGRPSRAGTCSPGRRRRQSALEGSADRAGPGSRPHATSILSSRRPSRRLLPRKRRTPCRESWLSRAAIWPCTLPWWQIDAASDVPCVRTKAASRKSVIRVAHGHEITSPVLSAQWLSAAKGDGTLLQEGAQLQPDGQLGVERQGVSGAARRQWQERESRLAGKLGQAKRCRFAAVESDRS